MQYYKKGDDRVGIDKHMRNALDFCNANTQFKVKTVNNVNKYNTDSKDPFWNVKKHPRVFPRFSKSREYSGPKPQKDGTC